MASQFLSMSSLCLPILLPPPPVIIPGPLVPPAVRCEEKETATFIPLSQPLLPHSVLHFPENVR